MSATLIFKDKYVYQDGAIRDMTIWRLPSNDTERPHGLKYRLFYGFPGDPRVIYDNERGKGDHRHYYVQRGGQEEVYTWVSIEQLISDFRADIEKLRGEKNG